MGHKIHVHLLPGYDKSLVPIPAVRHRDWWEDNTATRNHAKHCLPLSMANSLGYYILSPGTFKVSWDGNVHSRAEIEHIEKSSHYIVDNHAAFGSFAIQAQFIVKTDDPGDFIYIKGIPNERMRPYSCMEAIIEAWWNNAFFGLVYLLNQPGEFIIQKGEPIAQMFLYRGDAGYAELDIVDNVPDGHKEWYDKRYRKDYRKDLDYMKGLTPTGEKVKSHITTWKHADKYIR